MEKPFLTIAITTYNRSDYLKETLEFLLSETVQLRHDGTLEIIIIDNGSKDETYSTLLNFKKEKNLLIYKNDQNIEVSRNILKLAEYATGVYFWCFGDDDFISKTAIQEIVSYLKKAKPNHVVLDRKDFYNINKIDLEKKPFELNNLSFEQIRAQFNKFDRLFSFITANIYQTNQIREIFISRDSLLDNNYTNKYTSWIAAKTNGISYIKGPIAHKRCSIGQGSHFNSNLDLQIKTFIFDQARVALDLEKNDKDLGYLAFKKYLSDYRSLAKYKVDGADFKKIISELREIRVPKTFLLIPIIISLIPSSLLKAAIILKKNTRTFSDKD